MTPMMASGPGMGTTRDRRTPGQTHRQNHGQARAGRDHS